MPPLSEFLNFILHIDQYLSIIIQTYHTWAYLLIGFIVFLETGFVMTPFLTGDSLLFASGSFAALGALNIWILFATLSLAAIIGDSVNYSIGYYVGSKVFKQDTARFFKKEY